MALPTRITIRSYAGAATPNYLTDIIASGWSGGQYVEVNDTTDWYEINFDGSKSTKPLGTSGPFTLVVDYGLPTEEKILCASGSIGLGSFTKIPVYVGFPIPSGQYSAVNYLGFWDSNITYVSGQIVSSGTLSFTAQQTASGVLTSNTSYWTVTIPEDNGRGYDGTPINGHQPGTSADYNVFIVSTAVEQFQFNVSTAISIISGYPAGAYTASGFAYGDLYGVYPNPYLNPNSVNVQNIISNNASVINISGSLSSLTNSVYLISGNLVQTQINVAALSGNLSTVSGVAYTNQSNIATLSGYVYVTQADSITALISGQNQTNSNVAALSGSVSSISGTLSQISGSLSTTSGTVSAISGWVTTISGQVSNNTLNIATQSGQISTISGSLSTVSGVAYTNQSNLATLSGNVSTISGTLSTVQSNLATLSGNVSIISGQVTTNTNQIATQSGQINTISGTLSTTVSNLATLSGYVSTISGQSGTNTLNIATLSGYVSTISGVTYTNQSNLATLSGNVTTISGEVTVLSGNISVISGALTTISGVTYTNQSNLATLSGNVSTISGQVTTNTNAIATQSGQISTISGTLSTTVSNLTTLSGNVSTISGQVSTNTNTIATQSGQISTISGQVSTNTNQIVTQSGQISTISGSLSTTVSNLATLSGNVSSISGSLSTVSGVAYTNQSNLSTLSGNVSTISGQVTSNTTNIAALSGIAIISGYNAGGDLSGKFPSPTVAKIQGTPVLSTTPTNLQIMRYISASGAWVPGTGNFQFPTTTKSGNYTAVPNDYVEVLAIVAPITITLPPAPQNGSPVSVSSNLSSTYNVTVVTSGSDTIAGGSSFVLPGTGVFNSASFIYDANNTQWLIQSNQFGDSAGGDLTGNYPNPTVVRIQGIDVSPTPPNTGQVLASVGGVWTPITSSGLGTPGPGGAVGYWFAGYDTTNQILTTPTSGQPILIGTPTDQNGIVASSSGNITIGYTGTYNFQFSTQFTNTDNSVHDANIWIRKNGVNLIETNGVVGVPASHASVNGHTITSWNYILSASGGDKFQFMWTADTAQVSISTVSGLGSAGNAPGFIATVQQVMYNQTGTYTVNAVLASGNSQASATPLTLSTYAPVTGATASGNNVAGTGVVLGTPTYNGQWAQIHNQDPANWLLVYPNSGATIDQQAANGPIWIPPSAFWEGVATTTLSWDTKIQPITSTTINVSYEASGGQTAINFPSTGTPGTYGTASGVAVVTTDAQGRVSSASTTPIAISQSQVAGLVTLSGQVATNQSNISALSGSVSTISGTVAQISGSLSTVSGTLSQISGSLSTVSGSLSTVSGITYTNQTNISTLSGYVSTISGQSGTTTLNLATLSGSVSTISGTVSQISGSLSTVSGTVSQISGSLSTVSGTVAAISGWVTSISGALVTVSGVAFAASGVAYAALPRTGGTVGPLIVSGSLTVSGTTIISGTSTIYGNLTQLGTMILSGTTTMYSTTNIYGSTLISGAPTLQGTTIISGTVALGTTILNSGIYTNAVISGGLFQNNQVTVNSGNIVLLSGSISTISGTLSQISGSLSTTSGTVSTISGWVVSISGALTTVSGVAFAASGVAYAALPKTGGTVGTLVVSGGLTVSGTTIISGTSLNIYSTTVGAIAAASGYVMAYNGTQWVAASGIVGGGSSGSNTALSTVNLTAQNTAIINTTVLTTSTSGLFSLNYYAKVTTAATINSVLGPFNLTYTDPDGTIVNVIGASSNNNTLTSGFIGDAFTFYAASGTAIQYSMGYISNGVTAMQYNLHANLTTSNAGVMSYFSGGTIGSLTITGTLTVSGTTTLSGTQNFYGTTNLGTSIVSSGIFNYLTINSGLLNFVTSVSGTFITPVISGGLFQNNQVTVNSGNIVALSGSVASISGTVAQISGSLSTVSGTVAQISGSLSTVSGVAYALSNTQQASSVPASAFLVSGTVSQTYKAWTQDPVLATTTTTLITGTALYQAIWIPQTTTISGFSVSTSGGASTQVIFAALFNANTQVATFSGIPNTNVSTPTMRYSSVSGVAYVASPGLYYMGIVVSGTGSSSISFASLPSGNISLINLNIPGPTNSLTSIRSSQVVIGQRQFYVNGTTVSGALTTNGGLTWIGLF